MTDGRNRWTKLDTAVVLLCAWLVLGLAALLFGGLDW